MFKTCKRRGVNNSGSYSLYMYIICKVMSTLPCSVSNITRTPLYSLLNYYLESFIFYHTFISTILENIHDWYTIYLKPITPANTDDIVKYCSRSKLFKKLPIHQQKADNGPAILPNQGKNGVLAPGLDSVLHYTPKQ